METYEKIQNQAVQKSRTLIFPMTLPSTVSSTCGVAAYTSVRGKTILWERGKENRCDH